MEKFELHILGCGSALPTTKHFPSSQVVNIREKLFMIDCGEGAQLQFRKSKLKFTKLNAVFISHLHGDHCFGLMGLISTLNLMGRTADLHIYSPAGFGDVMSPMVDYFNNYMSYKVVFHDFQTNEPELLYEDRSLTIETIPLNHRMPTCGFLFKEKPTSAHINSEMTKFYGVPYSWMNRLKNGEDYVTPEGEVIPNSKLTTPPEPPRSYAYCSDTAFLPAIVDQIKGVNLLYHEATYSDEDRELAAQVYHSTTTQAATIAKMADAKKLVIGHFSSRYEDDSALLKEALEVFPETILAQENLVVEVIG